MFQGIVSGGISGVLCGQIKVGQGYPKNPRLREDCEGKADQQGAFERQPAILSFSPIQRSFVRLQEPRILCLYKR